MEEQNVRQSDLEPLCHGAALDAAQVVVVKPALGPEGMRVRGQRLGRNMLCEQLARSVGGHDTIAGEPSAHVRAWLGVRVRVRVRLRLRAGVRAGVRAGIRAGAGVGVGVEG